MSSEAARRDIEKRFTSNWATTVIAYDNVKFNKPEPDVSWCRLRIEETNVDRTNVGLPGKHRTYGDIIIEIYTPIGTGTRISKQYSDTIAEIFRDVQFSGITCREATPITVGEASGWWQVNLFIPFFYTATFSPSI